jgi:hypothetical protein
MSPTLNVKIQLSKMSFKINKKNKKFLKLVHKQTSQKRVKKQNNMITIILGIFIIFKTNKTWNI